ncbi:MAG: ABC transporter permease [Flavobacteriales bacterium]
MKLFFQLQFAILNRTLTELGSKPIFAYPLAISLFCGLSLLLFMKTEYAIYIYCVFALSLVYKLCEQKRNEFLKITFRKIEYIKIRIVENCIVVLPFCAFILFKEQYLEAGLLLFAAGLMSMVQTKNPLNYSIPTPFGKVPFEFPMGFRKTFYLFPIAYYLTFQAVLSENINLGIASIVLIGLVIISYYSKPENELYVWNYSLPPKLFLKNKIKICLTLFTYLILPILFTLSVFFFSQMDKVILFSLAVYVYLITFVLAKYSAYPRKMNIIEGLFIGLSIMFIPVLILIIPLLYKKSINQLTPILDDDKN